MKTMMVNNSPPSYYGGIGMNHSPKNSSKIRVENKNPFIKKPSPTENFRVKYSSEYETNNKKEQQPFHYRFERDHSSLQQSQYQTTQRTSSYTKRPSADSYNTDVPSPPAHHHRSSSRSPVSTKVPLPITYYDKNSSDVDHRRDFNNTSFSPRRDEYDHRQHKRDDEYYGQDKAANDEHSHHHPHHHRHQQINKIFLHQQKRKFKYKISANISGTKFDIVRHTLEALGCKMFADDNFDCNLIWDDTKVSVEGISELKAFQRYNHFPAMSEISRKDALARNITKISKVLPQDFEFVPKTWIMPNEYSSLVSYSIELKRTQQPKKTFILKPSNGAMGHGIKLYRNVEKIQPTENYIVQEYISNPYLLDGYKFDLRIYVLVTSCDPLRAFIFNNGLVRLGTEEYQEPHESNIDHLYMHLTNYSVNKRNVHNFDDGANDERKGTKRSLEYLFDYLRHKNVDSSKLWRRIQDVVLKTLLVAEPYLFHTYKMCRPGQLPGSDSVCFEILGFDILLDDKLKPWVIEVNRSPSFGANQQIDFNIKSKLLLDTFELLHLKVNDRQRTQNSEKAEAKRRLYNQSLHLNKQDYAIMSSMDRNSTSSITVNPLLKYKSKEKRKLEIIEQIKLLRLEIKRQEYENRKMGNFSRLFPINDKQEMEFYLNILSVSFNIFYPIGKTIQWKKTYEEIKEEKLIEELTECDDDARLHSSFEYDRNVNNYLREKLNMTDTEDESRTDDSEDDSEEVAARHRRHKKNERDYYHEPSERRQQKRVSTTTILEHEHTKANRVNTLLSAANVIACQHSNSLTTKTVASKNASLNVKDKDSIQIKTPSTKTATPQTERPFHPISGIKTKKYIEETDQMTQHLIKQLKNHQVQAKQQQSSNTFVAHTKKENLIVADALNAPTWKKEMQTEEISIQNTNTLTIAALKLLNQLEIKFPGKSNEMTKNLLNKIYDKIEAYKPKLSQYWLTKLDDAKRAKIINIVRSNVNVILQKVFLVDTLENLRLYKIFIKLFNRMLWMHGQGLWNCFISDNNSSWELIFNKSTFSITDNELKCCLRVVELCKDCVIIVYQYAFEQTVTQQANKNNDVQTEQRASRTALLDSYNTSSSIYRRNKYFSLVDKLKQK